MKFTEHLFDRAALVELTAETRKSLEANSPGASFMSHGIGVVLKRLEKSPLRYRDYGPYWWALKEVLKRAGHDLGPVSYPPVAATYVGNTDEETIVAADKFRELYLSEYPIGTNKLTLDGESGDMWELLDEDMESR